jgi:hypothetical protein
MLISPDAIVCRPDDYGMLIEEYAPACLPRGALCLLAASLS